MCVHLLTVLSLWLNVKNVRYCSLLWLFWILCIIYVLKWIYEAKLLVQSSLLVKVGGSITDRGVPARTAVEVGRWLKRKSYVLWQLHVLWVGSVGKCWCLHISRPLQLGVPVPLLTLFGCQVKPQISISWGWVDLVAGRSEKNSSQFKIESGTFWSPDECADFFVIASPPKNWERKNTHMKSWRGIAHSNAAASRGIYKT